MNLVKWFRKNNKKVLAVAIIFIMVGFIGGPILRRIAQRGTGQDKTVAWLGDGRQITNRDLNSARRELETLKMLRTDVLLRNINQPLFGTKDLNAFLLGELLFAERRISPEAIKQIKQIIRANQYRISDKQINDIYRGELGNQVYWLLLKTETQAAGIRLSNEHLRRTLAGTIPQLFPEATYSQLIGSLINRLGIPEKQILATFGRLLAVLEYAQTICSSENVTGNQIMHTVSREQERIDVEFVKFDSAVFAESQAEPTQQETLKHFDKYKKFFAGAVSEQNPYGFGYKLPDRVQLEYIAVKLDDVSSIITAPTHQQAEEYYQKHREQFTEQVAPDPNDPNSPPIERTKNYAEVATEISNYLLQDKINSKTERILQEAKTLTEADLEDTEAEPANLSAEQTVGDYKEAAEQLSKKYEIEIYAGQTGLLGAADIQQDELLGRLYVGGYGYNPVGLARVVFAIEELGVSELGPFNVQKPKLYENVGPVRDVFGQIMAVVRVKKAEKTSEPESINLTFSKETLRLEQTPESEKVYSVKEKVAEDLKKLAAMETTKNKAEEFVKQVVKDGWEGAIEKFNKLYGQQDKQDQGEPNTLEPSDGSEPFKLDNFTDLPRISRIALETLAVQSEGDPAAQLLGNDGKKNSQFIDRLYSLVPQDANNLESVPLVIEFKPEMSWYCLKSISVRRLDREEYEKIKAWQVYKEDTIQSQSLSAVHFAPENILKRLNFRWAPEE